MLSTGVGSIINVVVYYFVEKALDEVARHVENLENKVYKLERSLKENKVIPDDSINALRNKTPDNISLLRPSMSKSDVSGKCWECSCGFRNSLNDDFCRSCFKKKR